MLNPTDGDQAIYLSRAVSCSNMNREVEPQCSWVDVRVSSPTRDDMDCRSASVKRVECAGLSSPLPESSATVDCRTGALAARDSGFRGLGSAQRLSISHLVVDRWSLRVSLAVLQALHWCVIVSNT